MTLHCDPTPQTHLSTVPLRPVPTLSPRPLMDTWVPTYQLSPSRRNPGVRPPTLWASGHEAEVLEPPASLVPVPLCVGQGRGEGQHRRAPSHYPLPAS